MVAHGRVELLAHPLSQKYLQMKWNSYGKYFHLTNLLFYCIFLGSITCFSSQLMEHEKALNFSYLNLSNMTTEQVRKISTISGSCNSRFLFEKYAERKSEILNVQMNYSMYICAMVILVFIVVNGAREVAQMLQQKCVYFFNPINLVTWCLYGSSVVMVSFFSNFGALLNKGFSGSAYFWRGDLRNPVLLCFNGGFSQLVQPAAPAAALRPSGNLRGDVSGNIADSH